MGGWTTDSVTPTDSNAQRPENGEAKICYTVLPEEMEDKAEIEGPETVTVGKALKFSVTPEAGYEIESVTADGEELEGKKNLLGNTFRYELEEVTEDREIEITLCEKKKAASLLSIQTLSVPTSSDAVYVSESGDDANGDGSREKPFATLAKAVEKAEDGETVYLLTDLVMNESARVINKSVTIDGNGYTVTRGQIGQVQDNARSTYNPAMFEINNWNGSVESHTLTFRNIILDDDGKAEGTDFSQQSTDGTYNNEDKVQDGIISTYTSNEIILDEGAILQNYGGMSAVRITADGSLIMKEGSRIYDTKSIERGHKNESTAKTGQAGAVWIQSADFIMEEGAEIADMNGRAVYLDGGNADVSGTVSGISGNAQMWQGCTGIAFHIRNTAEAVLRSGGSISGITGATDSDSAVATYNGNFTAEKDSVISEVDNIFVVYADNLGGAYNKNALCNGIIENCETIGSLMRSWYAVITLGPDGIIRNCTARGAGGLLYTNNGSHYVIQGKIINNTASKGMMYLANQSGGNVEAVIEEGALISDNKGLGIRVNNGSWLTMNGGEISGNTGSGIEITGKTTAKNAKFIMNGGKISGNSGAGISFTAEGEALAELNGGEISGNGNSYQILVSGGGANSDSEHLKVKQGVLGEKRAVFLSSGTVTLDEGYEDIQLGNARTDAVNKIKELVQAEKPDWTPAGSSALWIRPSGDQCHFTISRPYSVMKTGLFMAYLPLKEDGTPQDDAALILKEVENTDPIDVTLSGLTPDTAYALMFVNNAEYTLSPDNITIYTGGGQGAAVSETGFPEITLTGCLDDIETLEVNGSDTGLSGDEAMEYLLGLFHVTYMDMDGTVITDDTRAGEYEAVLEPNDPGMQIRINGNEIAGYETGTLVVRHTADIEGAQSGTSIHPLESTEPAEAVEHAVAVSKKFLNILEANYYINNDEERKIRDTSGISLLDDSLLLEDENDNRQYLMEQRAEEFLGAPSDSDKGYKYDFHYLDLVDVNNGNAWVSASYGSVVYLPYPEGTDAGTEFRLIHFQDLHREYGISGQAEVEEAIRSTRMEELTVEKKEAGLRFETERAGFSPFALVWEVPQNSVTIEYLDAEDNSAIANPVTRKFETGTAYDVTEETEKTFQGYTLDRVEGTVKGSALNEDITIRVYYKKVVVPPTEYTITIRYMDKESGMELAAPVILTYPEGTAYDVTEEAGKEISGYTLDHVDGNVKGDSLNSHMEIRVFYGKNEVPPAEYTITVNYLEKTTQKKLAEPFVTTAAAGSAYDVSEQAGLKISGYEISAVEGSVKGETLDGNMVIYVYYVAQSTDSGSGDSGDDGDGGSGSAVYTAGISGNWVHVDPENTDIAISRPVPEGATPTTAPEYHQWKFILNDGTAVSGKWAYVKNPYAVGDQPKEGWFCFNAQGIMQYGWFFDAAVQKWYYLHRNSDGMLGTMMEGWHFDDQDGKWYYLKPGSGEMLTGWQEIGGKWYYLNPDPVAVTWDYDPETGGWTYNGTAARPFGSMYSNETTPDGYQVDETGEWIK